jgi:hypothetical protein
MSRKENAFTLTEDEIIERLRTNDIDVINSIHEMCLDVLYKEDERTKSLDAKGSTLLGITGLSSSVVFTLGGLLIEKIKAVTLPVIGDPVQGIGLFYISSSITLLFSILFALLSVRARADFRWLKDEDIFRGDMIDNGIGPYKRYMATHAWKVYRNNFIINEKKGKHLRTGHVLFFAGLLQLLPIILIIGLYAFMKGG